MTADYPLGVQDFDPAGRGGVAPIIYVGPWAGKPSAASLQLGDEAIITDIPVGGRSVWYWDGVYWRSYGALKLGGSAVASATWTGSTAVQPMASVVIPAKSLGINGLIDLDLIVTQNNNANVKAVIVYLGGQIVAQSGPAAFTYHGMQFKVRNRGSMSGQISIPVNMDTYVGQQNLSPFTTTLDTSVDQTLGINFQLANAADTMVLEAWSAVLYN